MSGACGTKVWFCAYQNTCFYLECPTTDFRIHSTYGPELNLREELGMAFVSDTMENRDYDHSDWIVVKMIF